MFASVKTLGISLLTGLTLTATLTQAAIAAEFHSNASSTVLKGVSTSNHVLDLAGTTLTCTGAEFNGTQTGFTAPSVTLTMNYIGCKDLTFGFNLAATFEANGCAYQFSANDTIDIVNNPSGGNCAANPITFRVSNFLGECDLRIGPQSGLSGVTYTGTSESDGTIKMAITIPGVSGTASGSLCPETGAFTNGHYTEGRATLTGNGGAAKIWVTH